VATQLTRRHVRALFAGGAPVFTVQPRVLLVGGLACIAVTYLGLGIGVRTARQDQRIAEARYADTLALLEAPAPSLASLQSDIEAARTQVAAARRGSDPTSLDPSSDAVTELLIRRAQAAGLTVTGLARVTPTRPKIADVTYDAQAVRISATGSPGQVVTFLFDLDKTEPALIPSVSQLTVDDDGRATAAIVFSVYAPAPVTPVAGARATPVPAR
jgi:hypothetical protein